MYIGTGIKELQEPVQPNDRKPLSPKILQHNSDVLNSDALMKLIENSELDSITTGISQESEVESKVESKVNLDHNVNNEERQNPDRLSEPRKSVNLVSRIT